MKILLALLISVNTMALDYKVVCDAKGHSGDSVVAAIEACSKHTTNRRANCAKDVTCATYKTHCTSYGVAGDNVLLAVANCRQYSRNSTRNCSAEVTCH
ncbi:hypothetical protein A9Q84_06680 [Halobacteriovorax marinus]|uniref:Uncharacterized protein n=1 Tax=Halobacteriovorax marinus TaxID=97084 RepID=A0A1Y5F9T0_9BACT|nr:hypothetical protein A9Q84_06680 [Halobacteriovorax marinus]